MAPVEPMTAGNLYIFDYLTSSPDMDLQDLNGKTLGSDYCYIPSEALRGSGDQEGELVYYPGGVGFKFSYDQDKGLFLASSDHMTRTEFAAVKRYWKLHRDNDADPDYLCFYRAATVFYPFHDEDGTEMEYLRGWFKKKPYEGWTNAIPDLYGIRIEFNEVWS